MYHFAQACLTFFFFETGSPYIALIVLELTTQTRLGLPHRDLSACAFPVLGIKMCTILPGLNSEFYCWLSISKRMWEAKVLVQWLGHVLLFQRTLVLFLAPTSGHSQLSPAPFDGAGRAGLLLKDLAVHPEPAFQAATAPRHSLLPEACM